MTINNYDIVAPHESEEVLSYTIDLGKSLVLYGADDFGQILSWINLADLALEFVPSCRDSLHTCLDWFGSNRERVEVALAILRDARAKVHNPLYFGVYQPTNAYLMLVERVCDGRPPSGSPYYRSEARSLSCRDFSSEERR